MLSFFIKHDGCKLNKSFMKKLSLMATSS